MIIVLIFSFFFLCLFLFHVKSFHIFRVILVILLHIHTEIAKRELFYYYYYYYRALIYAREHVMIILVSKLLVFSYPIVFIINDINQIRFEFNLKISINQFCNIEHISQIIYQNELKVYREILDTWNYNLINFQVKYSLRIYYFIGSKLLDKSYQIYQTRHLYTV